MLYNGGTVAFVTPLYAIGGTYRLPCEGTLLHIIMLHPGITEVTYSVMNTFWEI